MRATRPALAVTISAVDHRSAVAAMATGTADIALVDGISAPDNPLSLSDAGLLLSTALIKTPIAVALPTRHPLSSRASLDLESLTDAPRIVAPALAGGGAADLVPASRRTPMSIVYDGTDLPTLLALIAADHGLALLPMPACQAVAGVVAVPLRQPRLVHRTEIITLRNVTDLQRQLVDLMRARGSLS